MRSVRKIKPIQSNQFSLQYAAGKRPIKAIHRSCYEPVMHGFSFCNFRFIGFPAERFACYTPNKFTVYYTFCVSAIIEYEGNPGLWKNVVNTQGV